MSPLNPTAEDESTQWAGAVLRRMWLAMFDDVFPLDVNQFVSGDPWRWRTIHAPPHLGPPRDLLPGPALQAVEKKLDVNGVERLNVIDRRAESALWLVVPLPIPDTSTAADADGERTRQALVERMKAAVRFRQRTEGIAPWIELRDELGCVTCLVQTNAHRLRLTTSQLSSADDWAALESAVRAFVAGPLAVPSRGLFSRVEVSHHAVRVSDKRRVAVVAGLPPTRPRSRTGTTYPFILRAATGGVLIGAIGFAGEEAGANVNWNLDIARPPDGVAVPASAREQIVAAAHREAAQSQRCCWAIFSPDDAVCCEPGGWERVASEP